MPPNSVLISDDSHMAVAGRDILGGNNISSITPLPISEHHIKIAQIFAVTASSVSIVTGIVSLYWFIRRKRMFRHSLIMLLIISDLFKALWQFIPPIVNVAGRRSNGIFGHSKFCQASGFFLVLGIEGSDFAALVIAVHSALEIFSSKASKGEGGLYNYRYVVYGLWVLIPMLMGGLAFINTGEAYVSQGAFCYLPVRPLWYRLALSWIPRYLILLTIFTVYVSIYLFVRRKFKNLESITSESYRASMRQRPNTTRSFSNPTSRVNKPMTDGNSISRLSVHINPGSNSLTSADSEDVHPVEDDRAGPCWEDYELGVTTPLPKIPKSECLEEAVPISTILPTEVRKLSDSSFQTDGSNEHTYHIIRALRESRAIVRHHEIDGTGSVEHHGVRISISTDMPVGIGRLQARHTAIKRQLRYLFVYPIIYFCYWIIPFIQHCLNYTTWYPQHPSFVFSCIATTVLALQCTADVLVFSYREKPWRYVDNDDIEYHSSIWTMLTPRISRDSSHVQDVTVFSRKRRTTPQPLRSSMLMSRAVCQRPGRPEDNRNAGARAAKARRALEVERNGWDPEERARERERREIRRLGQNLTWWEVEGTKRKDSVLLGTDTPTRSIKGNSTRIQTSLVDKDSECGQARGSVSNGAEMESAESGNEMSARHSGQSSIDCSPPSPRKSLDDVHGMDDDIDVKNRRARTYPVVEEHCEPGSNLDITPQ